MKRHGHLYERVFSRANLLAGYRDASRHKHGTRACFEFERCLGSHMEQLHQELAAGVYRPRPYHTFMVYEPKPRQISAPAFRDLVVQHAIYRVVGLIFDRTFISASFACRKGYGTHRAADYTQRALQQSPPDSWTLQLDIRKFFYRIDRGVLRQLVERKIKDGRLVDVMMRFAERTEPLGIPIGNLLSQIYALIYLNPVDHFVKRVLKARFYVRYVDDFVLFGLSRAEALAAKATIIEFLGAQLHLELSRWSIAKRSRGVNFVGYRTWASRRFVRRRALWVARRAVKAGRLDSFASSLGHARRTHSYRRILSLQEAACPPCTATRSTSTRSGPSPFARQIRMEPRRTPRRSARSSPRSTASPT